MKIGVIVVNYNKKDLLEKCLTSVFRVKYDDFQVVVVDNGSNDGSQELVAKKFSQAKIIEMGYNSGFCKANNSGINTCLSDGCDAMVLLNNDTEVDGNFLTSMASSLDANKKIGMIASRVICFNSRNLIDSAGLEITPDGLSKNRGLGGKTEDYDLSQEVFCPAGAAALFTRELLEDIEFEGQFLDESYEYYYEELDLGWRARLRGWVCFYCSGAIVYHHKSATSGAYSEFVGFYTNRNIYYNIIKNYPGGYFVKAVILSMVRYFFLALGFVLKTGVASKINDSIGFRKTISVTLHGLRDVVINLKRMIKKRRYIQKRVVVKKKEIRVWFKEFGLNFFDSVYK
jgi:GT2 family glycosyltransferase